MDPNFGFLFTSSSDSETEQSSKDAKELYSCYRCHRASRGSFFSHCRVCDEDACSSCRVDCTLCEQSVCAACCIWNQNESKQKICRRCKPRCEVCLSVCSFKDLTECYSCKYPMCGDCVEGSGMHFGDGRHKIFIEVCADCKQRYDYIFSETDSEVESGSYSE